MKRPGDSPGLLLFTSKINLGNEFGGSWIFLECLHQQHLFIQLFSPRSKAREA